MHWLKIYTNLFLLHLGTTQAVYYAAECTWVGASRLCAPWPGGFVLWTKPLGVSHSFSPFLWHRVPLCSRRWWKPPEDQPWPHPWTVRPWRPAPFPFSRNIWTTGKRHCGRRWGPTGPCPGLCALTFCKSASTRPNCVTLPWRGPLALCPSSNVSPSAPLYSPVFLDGWKPQAFDSSGRPLEDPIESEHKQDALRESRTEQSSSSSAHCVPDEV